MLSVACSADEAEAVEEMKARCGLGSDADLVRTALWHFSEHLEMDIDLRLGVFDCRPGKGWTNEARAAATRAKQQAKTEQSS